MRLLLRKYLQESWLLLSACSVMLFAFCWMRIWIVCQFELDKFAPMLKQFKAFEKFAPVPLEQFLTHAGSIAMAYNEPVLLLCIVVWSISRGSDVVSGELGRGTMEMLLAQPITRTQIVLSHALVGIGGLVVLCSCVWLGTYFGIATNTRLETITPTINVSLPLLPVDIPIPAGESTQVRSPLSEVAPAKWFVVPTLNLFAFGFFLLALTSMCSCFDRYRWRTIGVVIGFYVIQFLLFLLSKALEFTGWCGYFSFFSLYQPDAMVQLVRNHPEGSYEIVSSFDVAGWEFWLGPLGMTLLLVAMGLICFTTGWRRFIKRDLPAPV